jgi:adhesin transport system outer membrane protein
MHAWSMPVLAFAAGLLLAPPATAQTLRDAVREALGSHPELSAIGFNRKAVDEEKKAAAGAALPTVDVRASVGRDWLDGGSVGGLSQPHGRVTREAGVYLGQRLYDGDETFHEIGRQRFRGYSARARVYDTANALALRTVQAYIEVQRAQAILGLTERHVAHHRALLGQVSARVESGKGAASEAIEAKGRLDAALAALTQARGRVQESRIAYANLVGRQPGRLSAVELPRKALPPTVAAAVAAAREGAPAVLALQFESLAAEHAAGMADSRFRPRVDLQLSATHVDRLYYGGAPSAIASLERGDGRPAFGARVGLSMNLYRGGADTARAAEARYRSAELRDRTAATGLDIEREIRLSWTTIETSTKRAAQLGTQLQSSRAIVSAYREQFDLGKRTLLDLLDLQQQMFVTEADRISEGFVARFNAYRILAGTGTLLAHLRLEPPADATAPPPLAGDWVPSLHGGGPSTQVDLTGEATGSIARPSRKRAATVPAPTAAPAVQAPTEAAPPADAILLFDPASDAGSAR